MDLQSVPLGIVDQAKCPPSHAFPQGVYIANQMVPRQEVTDYYDIQVRRGTRLDGEAGEGQG